MIDILKYLLQQVNDWLKFAEAKNFALVVFNTSVIIATLNVFDKLLQIYLPLQILTILFTIVNVVSLCIAFLSIKPKLKKLYTFFFHNQEQRGERNYYYFGDLAFFDPKTLLEDLQTKYNVKSDDKQFNQEMDLAKQIITNSSITLYKYKLFTLALNVTIYGVSVYFIIFVILLFSIKLLNYA